MMHILIVAAEYGGDSDLLYSQFELHTREQKMNQITLIEVDRGFVLQTG